jgi:hypothetical protein
MIGAGFPDLCRRCGADDLSAMRLISADFVTKARNLLTSFARELANRSLNDRSWRAKRTLREIQRLSIDRSDATQPSRFVRRARRIYD